MLKSHAINNHQIVLWMQAALTEAREALLHSDVPVGAIVVRNGEIIASAHNEVEKNQNPSAHAELLAIQRASAALGNWRLQDCSLIVTLEPCAMCMGALMLARVSNIFFGAHDLTRGAAGSLLNLADIPFSSPKPKIVSGVLLEESKKLLDDFFLSARDR